MEFLDIVNENDKLTGEKKWKSILTYIMIIKKK